MIEVAGTDLEDVEGGGRTNADAAWRLCDETVFRPALERAVAALPAFEREEIALLSGLILPVWMHLPNYAPTIRRVRTDCGQNLIGRITEFDVETRFRVRAARGDVAKAFALMDRLDAE